MSLDLMKSYGRNLTTFGIEEVRTRKKLNGQWKYFFFLIELSLHGLPR